MKKSKLAEILQKEVESEGDCYLLNFTIRDEYETSENYMLSPNRITSKGSVAKMNFREFKEFLRTLRQFEHLGGVDEV